MNEEQRQAAREAIDQYVMNAGTTNMFAHERVVNAALKLAKLMQPALDALDARDSDLAALHLENERLRKALVFYANYGEGPDPEVIQDGGDVARAALAERSDHE